MKKFTVIKEKPNIVEFNDEKEFFGEVEEITSRAVGAERANVAKVTLPGTLHAARPKDEFGKLVLLCVASPAFSPDDVFNDPRGRKWTAGPYFKGQNAFSIASTTASMKSLHLMA